MLMMSALSNKCMHQYQGTEVRAVACGGEHSLAATETGELYTWGWGRYGNLGLGRADDRLVPVKVEHQPDALIPPSPLCTPCTHASIAGGHV